MHVVRFGFLLLLLLAFFHGGSAVAQTLSPINFTYEGNYVNTLGNPQYTHDSNNNSYATGALINGDEARSFFSFDLSSVNFSGKKVVAATFSVTRANYLTDQSSPRASQILDLYDVSTSASSLHNGGSSATDGTIFTDLGSGKQYAAFAVSSSGNPTDVLNISLNSFALADINSQAGGFFSLGGSLPTASTDFGEAVFVNSNSPNTAQLTLTLAPTPEPSAITTLSFGALGVGILRWRARRRAFGADA